MRDLIFVIIYTPLYVVTTICGGLWEYFSPTRCPKCQSKMATWRYGRLDCLNCGEKLYYE